MKNTVVYLIRHSTRFSNDLIETYNTSQENIIKNEKIILSVEGEKRAEILSNEEELQNLDLVYTSNHVRTLQTAKYIIEKQKLKVHIDERFDERKVGIPNDKLVPNWLVLQFKDENYKTVGGESQKEVRDRFYEAFNEIVENNKGKRIAIFAHGYSILFFLLKWCKFIEIHSGKKLKMSFNDNILIDKEINAPEVFKLVLDSNNNPIEITNIEFDDLK